MLMDYTGIGKHLRRRCNVMDEITKHEPNGLPVFMINDRESLQELVDRWLVSVRGIWNYKTPTAFLTNDLTRLQAIADIMFPLSQ